MRKKKEHDFSVTAFRVVQQATGQIEPKPKPTIDFKALGRLCVRHNKRGPLLEKTAMKKGTT